MSFDTAVNKNSRNLVRDYGQVTVSTPCHNCSRQSKVFSTMHVLYEKGTVVFFFALHAAWGLHASHTRVMLTVLYAFRIGNKKQLFCSLDFIACQMWDNLLAWHKLVTHLYKLRSCILLLPLHPCWGNVYSVDLTECGEILPEHSRGNGKPNCVRKFWYLTYFSLGVHLHNTSLIFLTTPT